MDPRGPCSRSKTCVPFVRTLNEITVLSVFSARVLLEIEIYLSRALLSLALLFYRKMFMKNYVKKKSFLNKKENIENLKTIAILFLI